MSISFSTIGKQVNYELFFSAIAAALGFGSAGEIDRFVFNVYAKTIREIKPADRLNGAIFVLEPPNVADASGTSMAFKPMLQKIQVEAERTLYSVRLDLAGGLSVVHSCTPDERRSLVSGSWSLQAAQSFSRDAEKCVVWAMAVGIYVYLKGDLYFQSADVIDELASGMPKSFEDLSWDDGAFVFEFAKHKLNDTSDDGIWHLPDICLLCPKPEVRIRNRLGEFLKYRLATYHHHDEEPLVEHEGQADISLHLIDGRVLIVEIKWIGCSLVATRIGETKDAIKKAITDKAKGWLTRFNDDTITSGLKQLATYYATGKYGTAYLAIFDCTEAARSKQSHTMPVPAINLDGHNPANFRILRAYVDQRSASIRART